MKTFTLMWIMLDEDVFSSCTEVNTKNVDVTLDLYSIEKILSLFVSTSIIPLII